MALSVKQDTYDAAVSENMEVFDLSKEEAIEETNKQFEAQGVDLSGIVTDLSMSTIDKQTITAAVEQLEKLMNAKVDVSKEEFIEKLTIIKTECDKGLEHRVFAGKEGAYRVVLAFMNKSSEDPVIVRECLKALIALMTKQPDLLDEGGIATMINFIDTQQDLEVRRLLFKWIKECCTMHEMNRQEIFDASILDHIKPLLNEANAALLRDVLGVLRALVLDDDVRVEFGRSHDHARAIASDTLCVITALLSKFKKDETVMNDVMLTISSLLVRTEFCKKVEDAGGLDVIRDVMITFYDNDKLMRQCLKVLKALSGNDECKSHIIQKDLAPVIASTLNTHKESVQTATVGLACVAALTLRAPDNSKALFEAGIPEIIVECMKIHEQDVNVQKNGSWAIRNMVSRSRYQNKQFLSLGAEDILQKDLELFASCSYDIKSALRDLGCKVHFKEEWTGKGGLLNTQDKAQ